MNVYIVADIEGTSGFSGFDVSADDRFGELERYRQGRELWAAEVNAAVAGALAAGAASISVLDNHASGDTFPFPLLHARAKLIHGRARQTWLPGLDDAADAVVIVGQHAMAGSAGHLAHTYSRRRIRRVTVNEREIGEIGLIAGIAGERGVSVVFVSGDDIAADEATAAIPGVTAVAVKRALSNQSCVSLPPAHAVELVEKGVRHALETRDRVAPVRQSGSVILSVDYRGRDSWRLPLRYIFFPRRGMVAGLRRVCLRDRTLTRAWDRFIGVH